MKRALLVTAIMMLTATSSYAGIRNSKHDLSSANSNNVSQLKSTTQNQVCIFCHTPHNAGSTSQLWNRRSASSQASAYKMYSSPSTSSAVNSVKSLDNTSSSYKCLTCHDISFTDLKLSGALYNNSQGTMNNLLSQTTWDSVYRIGNSPNLQQVGTGGDLRDDHPVHFDYAAAVNAARTQLQPLATAINNLKINGNTNVFPGNKMECGSCHLVHNEQDANNTGASYLLRRPETGSQICLSCHIK